MAKFHHIHVYLVLVAIMNTVVLCGYRYYAGIMKPSAQLRLRRHALGLLVGNMYNFYFTIYTKLHLERKSTILHAIIYAFCLANALCFPCAPSSVFLVTTMLSMAEWVVFSWLMREEDGDPGSDVVLVNDFVNGLVTHLWNIHFSLRHASYYLAVMPALACAFG